MKPKQTEGMTEVQPQTTDSIEQINNDASITVIHDGVSVVVKA